MPSIRLFKQCFSSKTLLIADNSDAVLTSLLIPWNVTYLVRLSSTKMSVCGRWISRQRASSHVTLFTVNWVTATLALDIRPCQLIKSDTLPLLSSLTRISKFFPSLPSFNCPSTLFRRSPRCVSGHNVFTWTDSIDFILWNSGSSGSKENWRWIKIAMNI